MSNLAPVQTDNAAWKATRGGKFTASTIGQLMMERSLTDADVDNYESFLSGVERWTETKTGKNVGERREVTGYRKQLREELTRRNIFLFGDTAKRLIIQKAIERNGGILPNPTSYAMTRGTLLEPAARILLSKYWTEIDGATFVPYGENSGCTPDGYIGQGSSTWDLKCPQDPADLMLYADAVPDGDFEALVAWNSIYAWQIMHQAKCCGVKYCTLTYFTDMYPLIPISDEERDEAQVHIDFWAERLAEQTGKPCAYQFASNGFAYVSRQFELTEAISARIDAALQQAEVLCQQHAVSGIDVLSGQVAQVSTQPEHIEPQVVTEASTGDVGVFECLIHHLSDMPWSDDLKSDIAKHGITKARTHIDNAMSVLRGTLKDLK